MAKDTASPTTKNMPERTSSAHVYLRSKTPPKVDFGEPATITVTGTIKSISEEYDKSGYTLDIEPATITVKSMKKGAPDEMTQAEYEAWRKRAKE